MNEVIQSRLKLHQERFDHIEYLSSNYSEVNWPGGGEKKYKKDFYERMVLKILHFFLTFIYLYIINYIINYIKNYNL